MNWVARSVMTVSASPRRTLFEIVVAICIRTPTPCGVGPGRASHLSSHRQVPRPGCTDVLRHAGPSPYISHCYPSRSSPISAFRRCVGSADPILRRPGKGVRCVDSQVQYGRRSSSDAFPLKGLQLVSALRGSGPRDAYLVIRPRGSSVQSCTRRSASLAALYGRHPSRCSAALRAYDLLPAPCEVFRPACLPVPLNLRLLRDICCGSFL